MDSQRSGPPPTRRAAAACIAAALVAATALAADADDPPWAPPDADAGYRRLTRDEVVNHTVRRDLLARIRDSPGITVGALALDASLDYKTVSHHARVLGEFRLVERHTDGRFQRLFPAGGYANPLRPLHEATATATVAALLREVAANPGIPPALLARRLGLAKSTVKWHMDRLVHRGIVEAQARGTGLALTVSPRFAEAVRALRGPGDGPRAS